MRLFYILPFVLLLHFEAIQAKNKLLHTLQRSINGTISSPWLIQLNNRRPPGGCWRQPWICNAGQPPRVRRRCCRNICVDVSSDVNNCGLCGIRCRFTRQCCDGRCVNTNRNPNHCGKCDNRCAPRTRCIFGMCGYAQPMPPFPFPRPRPLPPPMPDQPPRGRGGGRAHPPPGSYIKGFIM